MRWFRSHVRSVAFLALFALTVQFALSFAHVHVPGAASKAAGGVLVALFGAQAAADTGTAPPAPANPHPKGLLGDTCAICTLIQMAGSAPPTVAAQVLLPLVVGRATQLIAVGIPLAAASHTLAQARAPPIA
jgi:hypothetical protein